MQPDTWKFLPGLLILLLIAGCVPTPDIKIAEQLQEIDPLLQQVSALELAGDYSSAAEQLQQLAPGRASPIREQLLLRAAENWLQAGDTEAATRLIEQIDLTQVPDLDFRTRLIVAEMAISRGQADEVLNLLNAPPPQAAGINLRERYHRLRAEALRVTGNPLDAGRELGELDLLLLDPEQRLANQLAIVQTYAVLTDTMLDLLQPGTPGLQSGWIDLTRIIKRYGNQPEAIQPLFDAWRERYPTHPALPEFLTSYYQKLQAPYRLPGHIAVMLPQQGPFAKAAGALRDGMLAAYFQQPVEQRPQLLFYDSSNPDRTWPLYQQAVDVGAEMVIGPLTKQNVEQLANAGELAVPVLALNQVSLQRPAPGNFYQFGLSPEDEARQVAERAWRDGHSSAAVLTPKSGWGERIYRAFSEQWQQLGGRIAEHQEYDPKGNDFSQPIKALLNIDQSEARSKAIQRLLGKKLETEPRRRQDIGFIFLAANAQKARQIRPQIQFHRASRLPLYSTSHAFSGKPSAVQDQDLEGLIFPEIPWLLVDDNDPLSLQQVTRALPSASSRYWRLYAMGIDSYQLLEQMARLQISPTEQMDGRTGSLSMDASQVIQRQLMWARIEDGLPQIIDYQPAAAASEDAIQADAPLLRPVPGAPTTAPGSTPAASE